ncbi:MAG TPA: hypothetical protein DD723_05465 [Candidatus Omnitrophica bacterium]|nr:MAG: hypothetical protein A2Z81_05585 [Omnitrophica WOR_2 bacterium GWA2_45_18]HBR14977.1 hypothetical protein [Candidatus Omnitrophota bacterium]
MKKTEQRQENQPCRVSSSFIALRIPRGLTGELGSNPIGSTQVHKIALFQGWKLPTEKPYPLFGLVPWLAFLERQFNLPLLFLFLLMEISSFDKY